MGILKEFKNMLTSDGSDKLSSKRVITFLAFILISIAFLGNLIFGATMNENMFDGVIQIVWAGLGVVVGEHLLRNMHNNNANPDGEVDVEAIKKIIKSERIENTIIAPSDHIDVHLDDKDSEDPNELGDN